ncbi:MAG: hypothetical protein ABIU05_17270 [Nitrospirales bacterium]
MDIQSMVIESPTTPEALAVRAEHGKVMNDKTHPMHAGYMAGDKKAQEYVDGLYGKLAQTAPAAKTESLVLTEDMSGDGEAHASIEIALRNEFGFEYDGVMADMQRGARHVFEGADGQEALTVLSLTPVVNSGRHELQPHAAGC